jgi:hypothetical protein
VTLPLINIEAAAALVQGKPLPRDTTPPGPALSLTLNGGDRVAQSALVAVDVAGAADDASGVATMCLSDQEEVRTATECSGWMEFAASTQWNLTSGPDGNRTVKLFLADWAGNFRRDPAASAPIELRRQAALVINGGAKFAASRWVRVEVSVPLATPKTRVCFAQGPKAAAPRGCGRWERPRPTKRLRLRGGGQGPRTVRMFLRNQAPGALRDVAEAGISLDTRPPETGRPFWDAFTAAPGRQRGAAGVSFLLGASEAAGASGVAAYAVVVTRSSSGGGGGGADKECAARARAAPPPAGNGTAPPARVSSAASAPQPGAGARRPAGGQVAAWLVIALPSSSDGGGPPTGVGPQVVTHTFEGLDPGSDYTFRLCVADAAGNVAKGRPQRATAGS